MHTGEKRTATHGPCDTGYIIVRIQGLIVPSDASLSCDQSRGRVHNPVVLASALVRAGVTSEDLNT